MPRYAAPRRPVARRAPARRAPVRRRKPAASPGRAVIRAAPAPARQDTMGHVGNIVRQGVDNVANSLGGFAKISKAGLGLAGHLLGFGDYVAPNFSVAENSVMDMLGSGKVPTLQATTNREFVIRHREYIGDVVTGSTSAFNITKYPINAGAAGTFPWLATLAANFEQYRVNGMVFEFKSTSADALNSTNTALGTVIMCTEYNTGLPDFVSKIQMENHEFATSAKQSCSMLHPIECRSSQNLVNELYVRSGSVPSGQDSRLYDKGNFYIATVGQQGASVNIGELWVTFDITLLKPRMVTVYGQNIPYEHWHLTDVSTSDYFAGKVVSPNSNIGMTLSGSDVIFPSTITAGSYMFMYLQDSGTTGSSGAPDITAYSNCYLQYAYYDSTLNRFRVSDVDHLSSLVCIVHITGPSAELHMSAGTFAATNKGDVFIQQINADVA